MSGLNVLELLQLTHPEWTSDEVITEAIAILRNTKVTTGAEDRRLLDRVAALHTADDRFGECREDGHSWPCPTLRALGVDQ